MFRYYVSDKKKTYCILEIKIETYTYTHPLTFASYSLFSPLLFTSMFAPSFTFFEDKEH